MARYCAVRSGAVNLANVMLNLGASPRVKGVGNVGLVQIAVSGRLGIGRDESVDAEAGIDWLDMVEMLLQKHVASSEPDAEGKTPLERAKAAGDMLLVQCFVDL